jgi:hypothetical protein
MENNNHSNRKIKDLLKQLTKTDDVYSKVCTVTSVDEDTLTCNALPKDGGPEYHRILLSPSSNSTAVSIPNVGSVIFIHFLDESTPYVTSFDSISKQIVRATGEDASHTASLKEALSDFATDIGSALDVVTFNTPQSPTTPGMLEPGKTQVQTAIDNFIAELDKLYKE